MLGEGVGRGEGSHLQEFSTDAPKYFFWFGMALIWKAPKLIHTYIILQGSNRAFTVLIMPRAF